MRNLLINFKNIADVEGLSLALGVDEKTISSLAFADDQTVFYAEHKIPKKRPSASCTSRIVWEAKKDEIKDLHKFLLRKFTFYAEKVLGYPHRCAHGYISNKSIYTNASVHAGSKFLLKTDIEDFFPTISRIKIQQFLLKNGFQNCIAEVIARLVTINGKLELGLSSSPLFANLICFDLDNKLEKLGKTYSANYSRYSDDIAFSSNAFENLPSKLEIEQIFASEGFKMAKSKFKILKNGQAFYVTGLSISDSHPRIPKRMKRQIRQELYYAKKTGLKNHVDYVKSKNKASILTNSCSFEGYLRFMNSIEKDLANHFLSLWSEIENTTFRGLIYLSGREIEPRELYYYIDESEILIGNRRLLAIGIAQLDKTQYFNEKIFALIARHLKDPYSSGDKTVLSKKGLHFSEVSEEIRTDFIREIGLWPYKAFIAYDDFCREDYEQKYLKLFEFLLPLRLTAANQRITSFVFEENSKVDIKKVEEIVNNHYDKLTKGEQKRPLLKPHILKGKKNEMPCIAIVDFLLGIFNQYVSALNNFNSGDKNSGETAYKRFERVRDKIRLIYSFPQNARFTRKRIFGFESIDAL